MRWIELRASKNYPGLIEVFVDHGDASGNNDRHYEIVGYINSGSEFVKEITTVNSDALALYEKDAARRAKYLLKNLEEIKTALGQNITKEEKRIAEIEIEINRLRNENTKQD